MRFRFDVEIGGVVGACNSEVTHTLIGQARLHGLWQGHQTVIKRHKQAARIGRGAGGWGHGHR